MPLYKPSTPSLRMICLTTSIGPAKVLNLSCNLCKVRVKSTIFGNTSQHARDTLDLYEFEWHDNEALSGARAAASQDRQLLRHFAFSGQSEIGLSPKVVSGTTRAQ